MDQLERWLASRGLADVTPVLRANDFDLDLLPELTDADLEKLGLSIGRRKRLLKALLSLPSPAAPSATPTPKAGATAAGSAERRQLTVMFCDLVGSAALAARLDAEDLREIIAAHRDRLAAIVRKYAGVISSYMGDRILILFGHPTAHEDDAERAVHAALEIAIAVRAPGPQPGIER